GAGPDWSQTCCRAPTCTRYQFVCNSLERRWRPPGRQCFPRSRPFLRARHPCCGRACTVRTHFQIPALVACLRLQIFPRPKLGSRPRPIRCSALYLRHHRLFAFGSHISRPFGHWRGGFYHGDVTSLAARPACFYHRTSGSDSQRDLWLVGNLRFSSSASPICSTLVSSLFGMDRP